MQCKRFSHFFQNKKTTTVIVIFTFTNDIINFEQPAPCRQWARSRIPPKFAIYPLVTNELSHPYHLDEFFFIFRDIRSNFSFLFHFSMKIKIANRIAPDGTPRSATSHLGIFCLGMSHKKKARLISQCISGQSANRKRQLTVHPKIVSDM